MQCNLESHCCLFQPRVPKANRCCKCKPKKKKTTSHQESTLLWVDTKNRFQNISFILVMNCILFYQLCFINEKYEYTSKKAISNLFFYFGIVTENKNFLSLSLQCLLHYFRNRKFCLFKILLKRLAIFSLSSSKRDKLIF